MNKKLIAIQSLLVVLVLMLTAVGCQTRTPSPTATFTKATNTPSPTITIQGTAPTLTKSTTSTPTKSNPPATPAATTASPKAPVLAPQMAVFGNLYLAIDETGALFESSASERMCDQNLNRYKIPYSLMNLLSKTSNKGELSLSYVKQNSYDNNEIAKPVPIGSSDFKKWQSDLFLKTNGKNQNALGMPLRKILLEFENIKNNNPLVLFTDGNFAALDDVGKEVMVHQERIYTNDALLKIQKEGKSELLHIVLICPQSLDEDLQTWWAGVNARKLAVVHFLNKKNFLEEIYKLMNLIFPPATRESQNFGWALINKDSANDASFVYTDQPWKDQIKITNEVINHQLPSNALRLDWHIYQILGDNLGEENKSPAGKIILPFDNRDQPTMQLIQRPEPDISFDCQDYPVFALTLPPPKRQTSEMWLYTWGISTYEIKMGPVSGTGLVVNPTALTEIQPTISFHIIESNFRESLPQDKNYKWKNLLRCHDLFMISEDDQKFIGESTKSIDRGVEVQFRTMISEKLLQKKADNKKYEADFTVKMANKTVGIPEKSSENLGAISIPFIYRPIVKLEEKEAKYPKYILNIAFDYFRRELFPELVFNALTGSKNVCAKFSGGGACKFDGGCLNDGTALFTMKFVETQLWQGINIEITGDTRIKPNSCNKMELYWPNWNQQVTGAWKDALPSVSCVLRWKDVENSDAVKLTPGVTPVPMQDLIYKCVP